MLTQVGHGHVAGHYQDPGRQHQEVGDGAQFIDRLPHHHKRGDGLSPDDKTQSRQRCQTVKPLVGAFAQSDQQGFAQPEFPQQMNTKKQH